MSKAIKLNKAIRVAHLKRVNYEKLKAKNQENYNFAKVSALFANIGFNTMRLTDDWHGVDFIAHNPEGETLFIQLKGRFTIDKKYMGKEIYVCFPWSTKNNPRVWFLYPHDELVRFQLRSGGISMGAWKKNSAQSRKNPSKKLITYFRERGYELGAEGS